MTPTETVLLVEYIQACCPQQTIGEYTADAWCEVLALEPWLALDEAKAAVIELKRTRLFVDVSEVIAEARQVRSLRIATTPVPPPPPELLDHPAAYVSAVAAGTEAIARGGGTEDAALAMAAVAAQVRRELERETP